MQCGNMEELSAANSFIRPGTGGLDDYVRGKKDSSTIKKWDKRIDKWLEPTYGAIVFQEQIMGLISELMGISFGQADIYRRALEKMHKPANKKKVDYFNDNVIKLAVERGFTNDAAEFVRKMIIDNSGYAFNKSHAVCYSYISYYTAWVKVNYPLIFHKTMLNGNPDELGNFMDLAKEDNIILNKPHVNYSDFKTIIESEDEKSLRIGFNTIKGVGEKAVESIKAARPFSTINEYFEKSDSKATNKRVVESLISAGAFDGIGIKIECSYIDMDVDVNKRDNIKIENDIAFLNRKQLLKWFELYCDFNSKKCIPNYEIDCGKIKTKYINNYELVIEKNNKVIIPEPLLNVFELTINDGTKSRKKPKGQLKEIMSSNNVMADVFTRPLSEAYDTISKITVSELDLYLEELDNNDFSFLDHPLQKYVNKITIFKDAKDGDVCIEAGIILSLIQKTTSGGKPYYWLMLRTPRETIRITLWSNQYKQYNDLIKKHGLIKVRGEKGFGGMSCQEMAALKRQ